MILQLVYSLHRRAYTIYQIPLGSDPLFHQLTPHYPTPEEALLAVRTNNEVAILQCLLTNEGVTTRPYSTLIPIL